MDGHGLKLSTPHRKACFEPVWNTWYPSMGNLSDEFVDSNAKLCAELGFKNIIIDDGWMAARGDWTANRNVYSPISAPQWTVCTARGLRVVLWYFSMSMDERASAFGDWKSTGFGRRRPEKRALRPLSGSPRMDGFPPGDLMKRYTLDGLKLDFLDPDIGGPLVNCTGDHTHDIEFVSDAIRDVQKRMAGAIRAVKPDAIIEYRLNYANVANRQWGNCYRGQDTPSDPDLARRHLGLIRSWCRGVAPHCDPVYWPLRETDENVARFLATAVLYAVPRFPLISNAQPESPRLVRTWISFIRNKARMFAGEFEILSDDPHYSAARISSGGRTYLPCFLEEWPSTLPVMSEHTGTIIMFNGTGRPRIATRLEGVTGSYRLAATDIFHKPTGKSVTVKSTGTFWRWIIRGDRGMVYLTRYDNTGRDSCKLRQIMHTADSPGIADTIRSIPMKISMTRRHALATGAAAAGLAMGGAPSRSEAGELPAVWGEDFLTPWSAPDTVKRDLTPGPSHIRLSCESYRMKKAPNGSYGDWVKTIREAGYTACEAGAAQWNYAITDSEIREMQAALKQHDVEFYTLHVWINIIDPDPQKRAAAHALNCRAIEMATVWV